MKNVLLVDDSATILMSMEQLLGKVVKTQTASDGQQALQKLSGGYKPDLIITDINMPNMNGLELISQVKKLPAFRFTPILVLTTEYDESKRAEAKKMGATGWLVKPVKGQQMLDVLKQVLPGAVA
ncbi:response regulator [Catenovulum sediminis]|uniref:Response regulator n=1 Tax=Catenovulum sediminis TaxID=1740262 RepID=A0ABV1RNL3_9ALTE|nr:response regulator [Catenovulum sediminis]